jgi:tetraacyldisaccharide 4'-kinase
MDRLRDLAARSLNALWYTRNPLRWLLWPAAASFRALVAVRRRAYRSGWLESIDVGVPVIVVGNLTVGGTGKTPLTIWLAERLAEHGRRVGIVCSGYGGTSESWPVSVVSSSDALEVGDEAKLLARRAGCRVVAGPDRVAAARFLLRSGPLDIILSDDGLQHYRLRRAIEIAVVDGRRGLGNGLCLPAGPLREPASRLREVDAIVVNDGDFGHAGVARAKLEPLRVEALGSGLTQSLDDFAGQTVHAVAAIGNPDRFFDLLEAARLDVEPHALADHARLATEDLSFGDDAPVLITEKDAVKCEGLEVGNVWSVVTELKFASSDGERLIAALERLLEAEVANA